MGLLVPLRITGIEEGGYRTRSVAIDFLLRHYHINDASLRRYTGGTLPLDWGDSLDQSYTSLLPEASNPGGQHGVSDIADLYLTFPDNSISPDASSSAGGFKHGVTANFDALRNWSPTSQMYNNPVADAPPSPLSEPTALR